MYMSIPKMATGEEVFHFFNALVSLLSECLKLALDHLHFPQTGAVDIYVMVGHLL